MRQRMLLSILAGCAMLYYAVPHLSFQGGIKMYFSIVWVLFVLVAIGGNLAAFLYSVPKRKSVKQGEQKQQVKRDYGL
jgi:type VI protein secretion system component VasK